MDSVPVQPRVSAISEGQASPVFIIMSFVFHTMKTKAKTASPPPKRSSRGAVSDLGSQQRMRGAHSPSQAPPGSTWGVAQRWPPPPMDSLTAE